MDLATGDRSDRTVVYKYSGLSGRFIIIDDIPPTQELSEEYKHKYRELYLNGWK